MAGLFLDENIVHGLSPSDPFKVGRNNVDDGTHTLKGVLLPWPIDPEFSWLNHVCWIECELDSGMVVHRHLPQSVQKADTLGVKELEDVDFRRIDDKGVNLISGGKYKGVVQRMADSVYRFCLKGWARRAGYQIPIPKLLKIGGMDVTPDDSTPQKAFNVIVGNNSGIPIYFARWELWYTLIEPPKQEQPAPDNFSERIGPVAPENLPQGIQVPITYPDQNALPTGPTLVLQDPLG